MTTTLCHVAVLHVWRGEAQPAREQADALIALAREQGFVLWLGSGMCTRGWVLVEQGAAEEGIAQLHQGLAARGHNVGQTHNLGMLVEAYQKAGKVEDGLRALDELRSIVHHSAERHCEAEVYRLHGELLQQMEDGRQDAEWTPEVCFLRALEVARRQQAKSLELRAAISLSRLWQHQGKHAQAHQVLAEVYGWFTEGFDTHALHEARTLLAVLA